MRRYNPREANMEQQGFTLWFTGLSGSGKSTLANILVERLRMMDRRVELLDGDEVRQHLTKDLGFSKEDRDTNITRISYVAKLLSRNGVVAITAAISPYREARDRARAEIDDFVEIFVQCPLEICAQRDVKGLYAKAMRGEIPNFTGVSDPYEEPENPEILIRSGEQSPEESVHQILDRLTELGYLADVSVGAGSL
ncbi:MAG TPA: adenylyl-sulfate kinase [Chloroflexota bacterium]|nr:adenylyl-sulfate kinase [Chloroflexota bacterium]